MWLTCFPPYDRRLERQGLGHVLDFFETLAPNKGQVLSLTPSLPPALVRLIAGDALLRVATVAGTALLAAQLAQVAWKFVPDKTPSATAVTTRPLLGVEMPNAGRVFGVAPAAQDGTAPPSNIALTLVGTLAVSNPTAGLAILGPTPNDARLYATGSDVVPGVRLVEVHADHVLIERGGVRETLNLPRAGNGAMQPTGAPAIAEVVRQVAAAPEVIGDLMRPMPNYVAGQLRGFKLFPGRDRKKFEQMGLQPGDMVTGVNGVPIKDAQHGLEMLQSLGSSTSTMVTIERAGVIQSVTIDSSQLAKLADPNRPTPAAVPAPIESNPSNE